MFAHTITIAIGSVFVCSFIAYLFGYWMAVGDINEEHRKVGEPR